MEEDPKILKSARRHVVQSEDTDFVILKDMKGLKAKLLHPSPLFTSGKPFMAFSHNHSNRLVSL